MSGYNLFRVIVLAVVGFLATALLTSARSSIDNSGGTCGCDEEGMPPHISCQLVSNRCKKNFNAQCDGSCSGCTCRRGFSSSCECEHYSTGCGVLENFCDEGEAPKCGGS